MIPEGTYNARAHDWRLGYTGTGKEQIAVQFLLLDGEAEGQLITWYGFFTDATTDRTLESLKHCGWDCRDLFALDGMGTKDVQIVIKHEDDLKGVPRARVQWVNAPGTNEGPAIKNVMDDSQRKEFAARMKGKVTAFSKGQATPKNSGNPNGNGGSKRGAQRPPAAQPQDDDDIPF